MRRLGKRLLTPMRSMVAHALVPLARCDAEPAGGGGAADAPQLRTEDEYGRQAEAAARHGSKAVLMKGGHAKCGECRHLLVTGDRHGALTAARIATWEYHGTGHARAAHRRRPRQGEELSAAVRAAKDYVTAAIAAATVRGRHGRGRCILYRWW